MDNEELLQAIRLMIREETEVIVDKKLQVAKSEIMSGVTVLLDSEFKRGFSVLGDRLDEILEKMPSEDDMSIIDGSLAEHEAELKMLRQDVNSLKKAQ